MGAKTYEQKLEFLKEVTGRGTDYWMESYVDKFYSHYEFLLNIKYMFGAEVIIKLHDLVNEECSELFTLLKYIKMEGE